MRDKVHVNESSGKRTRAAGPKGKSWRACEIEAFLHSITGSQHDVDCNLGWMSSYATVSIGCSHNFEMITMLFHHTFTAPREVGIRLS